MLEPCLAGNQFSSNRCFDLLLKIRFRVHGLPHLEKYPRVQLGFRAPVDGESCVKEQAAPEDDAAVDAGEEDGERRLPAQRRQEVVQS
jgi:hypothetical protein